MLRNHQLWCQAFDSKLNVSHCVLSYVMWHLSSDMWTIKQRLIIRYSIPFNIFQLVVKSQLIDVVDFLKYGKKIIFLIFYVFCSEFNQKNNGTNLVLSLLRFPILNIISIIEAHRLHKVSYWQNNLNYITTWSYNENMKVM